MWKEGIQLLVVSVGASLLTTIIVVRLMDPAAGHRPVPRVSDPQSAPVAADAPRDNHQSGVTAQQQAATAAQVAWLTNRVRDLEQTTDQAIQQDRATQEQVQSRVKANLETQRSHVKWLEQGQQQAKADYDAWRARVGDAAAKNVTDAFDQGKKLRSQGKTEEALAQLQKVIESDPKGPLVPSSLLEIAQIERRSGNLDKARQLADRVVNDFGNYRSFDGQLQPVRGLVVRAELCKRSGDDACVTDTFGVLQRSFPGAVLGTGMEASEWVRTLL